MKNLKWLSVFLFAGFMACNSGENTSATTDSVAATTNTSHQMAMDTSAAMKPLPAVPDGAKVFFKNLKEGQVVSSPIKVEMGVSGIAIQPAGDINAGFGHHHLLIDAGTSYPEGEVVPTDAQHLHFGKGQTETEISLPAGKHVLTLQFADGAHRSYGNALAASITIEVK